MIDPLALVTLLAALTGGALAPDDADHERIGIGPPLPVRAARYFSAGLEEAQTAHLIRVGAWGAASVAGGAALVGGSSTLTEIGVKTEPELFGLGAQAVIWGAVNLGLVRIGAWFLQEPTDDLEEAAEAEDTWRLILLVNEGLDVGYVLFGAALVVAGLIPTPFLSPWVAGQLRGHGMGIVVQGIALLVLDGVALYEAYVRKEKLDRFRAVPGHDVGPAATEAGERAALETR